MPLRSPHTPSRHHQLIIVEPAQFTADRPFLQALKGDVEYAIHACEAAGSPFNIVQTGAEAGAAVTNQHIEGPDFFTSLVGEIIAADAEGLVWR